jgi:hypothetical protein
MRKKIFIILLTLAVLLALIIGQDLIYPSEWNQIHLGMSRQEVYSVVGQGRDKDSNWTGHFWNDSGILFRNEIEVFFANDKVSNIIQRQSFVTGQTIRIVRAEIARK